MKHHLYPKDGTPKTIETLDEWDEFKRLQSIATGLRDDTYRKQLTD
jgi:hypothetical protein